jgi:WD40 repeat protein/serine/threonine protein kinase
MPLDSVVDLFEALCAYRLLEPEQLEEVTHKLWPAFPEARALARELMVRGWLSPYQVNHLLQNRGRELILGSYILMERLGEGGMGRVFKARHMHMRRVSAIKIIRKECVANPDAIRRFRREIEAVAHLSHPNVVTAFDADQAGDTHFYVMEYVEGCDLDKLIKQRGPVPIGDACDYIRQAAQGLQHAFERGMVHRDIKPSNLLLTSKGSVIKILDLGLARLHLADAESTSTLTMEGSIAGTPDFISPEQARNSRQADIRSDLYSLGCTLYFLLTGRVPFPGGNLTEKLLKHQFDEPTPVAQLRPEVPAGVVAVIDRLLAKRPEHRYQTPAELAATLQADAVPLNIPMAIPMGPAPGVAAKPGLLAALPSDHIGETPFAALTTLKGVPSKDVSRNGKGADCKRHWKWSIGPLWQFVRTRRRVRRWSIAVVGLAVLAILGSVWIARPARPRLDERVTPPPTVPSPVSSPLDRLDARSIPPRERFDWQPRELVAVLGEHAGRTWGQPPPRLHHQDAVWAVAISRDGKRLASGGADKRIHIWDIETHRLRQTLEGHQAGVRSLAFSPDGRQLISGGFNGELRRWDLETAACVSEFAGHAQEITAVVFTLDGSRVLSTSRDKTLRVWDVASSEELFRMEDPKSPVWSVALFPDGKRAIVGYWQTARIWDIETGQELQVLDRAHERCVHAVAVSADGKQLLTGSCDTTARLWDAATGKPMLHLKGHLGQVHAVAFTPDGRHALSAGWDRTIRLWNLETGTEMRRFQGHTDLIRSLALSPDGRLAVTGAGGQVRDNKFIPGTDPTVRLWDVASGSELRPIEGRTGPTSAVAFSPVGTHLLTGSGDGLVRLWDLQTGKEVRRFVGHRNQICDLAWFADGKRFVSSSEDRTLRLWESDSGKELACCSALSLPARQLALGPDGRVAAACGEPAFPLWDVKSKQEIGRFTGHAQPVLAVAMDAGGRRVLSGGEDHTVRLWNGATRIELRRLDGHTGKVLGVALSGDGRLALSGSQDHTVRLWETDRGQERFRLLGHAAPVSNVALSLDGKLAASAAGDGKILIHDTATGRRLHEWRLPGPVERLVFAPDHHHLATANSNGTVYILRLVHH